MKNVHVIYHVQIEETNILVGWKELASLIQYSIDDMILTLASNCFTMKQKLCGFVDMLFLQNKD